MNIQRITYCLVFLFLPYFLTAQDAYDVFTNAEFLKAYKLGEEHFNKEAFGKAEKAFKKAMDLKPDYAATYRRLGIVYEIQKSYQLAAEMYDQCIELDPTISRTLYYQSGEMHLKNGNYEIAYERFKIYETYLNLPPESFTDGVVELDTETYFNGQLAKSLEDCKFGLSSAVFDTVALENLGPAINSEADDCFPYLSNDESWMFYTRMGERRNVDENLLFSTYSSGKWTNGKSLGEEINSEVNEGMGKATRDERQMYFPACNREDVLGVCDIFEAAIDGSQILDIQQLKGQVNSDRWDSQPSINCDGQALYFVSDRPGGFGGTDIWVSYIEPDGTWGPAKNLGQSVNSAQDEEAPFISDDGVTLYFASNGHPGLGDQDIFFSRKQEDDSWGTPQNLGAPINSPRRELGFFVNARGDNGYIASNREGGFGGLDIYKFRLPEKKDFEEVAYVKGTVKNAETGEGIQTKVDITGKGSYLTDEEGRFFVCFPTLSKLPASVDQKGFYPYRKRLGLLNWSEKGYVELDILLQPMNQAASLNESNKEIKIKQPEVPIPVPNTEIGYLEKKDRQLYSTSDVYFYFDQFLLTKEAQYTIDRLIEDIDPEQLALVVIEGYADQIGSDDYNQKLSEKRAEEVANYFKSKGLLKLKVTYRGYGKTKSSSINSKNRRVDIVVYYKT